MRKQYKSRVSSLMRLALNVVIALNILSIPHLLGQSPYRYDVIATSSGSVGLTNPPSINNNGEVSFAGGLTGGGGALFTDNLPNVPRDVMSNFSSNPFSSLSPHTQINDSRQIVSMWTITNTTPNQNWLRIVDGAAPLGNTFTTAAAANGFGGFNDFNEIYSDGLGINNNGRPVFHTRNDTTTTVLTSGTRPQFATLPFPQFLGPIFRPIISDNNSVVVRNGSTGNDPIVTYAVTNLFEGPFTIAANSNGFSQIGKAPSISKNDEAIAFYAELNPAGAVTLGTNPGPGIFVSVKLANGQRKIVRIAGRLVEDNSAPGGNNDDVCDPGETCVQGELGSNMAGNRIFFSSFDVDSRIDVAYISAGTSGIQDDLVMVSFIATPNIASDVPERTFNNQKGVWTQISKISSNDGTIRQPDKADAVAQVGQTISGNTLTNISVYDQIANSVERVAFWGSSNNGNMIIRAVRDPGTPVIFIAGVAGSTLLKDINGNPGGKLWLPLAATSSLLDLDIANPVKIPDVLRKDTITVPVLPDTQIVTYKPLLDYLKNSGYVEYNVDGNENNRNSTCGGQDINVLRAKHPTLFVFPYDWRKSNGNTGSNVNVTKLAAYIQCVRAIYDDPNTKVNIVAHSMGGLLARRYILDNPGGVHHVKTMITIGSPWLGAPRAMHALETGSFMSPAFDAEDYGIADTLFAGEIKQLIENFPGTHELIPSQRYFDLGGEPLKVVGVNYDFGQTIGWINSRHLNSHPGTNTENFHSLAQDDFRGDNSGVNYYHIYGRQMRNRTVGTIEPRVRMVASGGGVYSTYDQIYPTRAVGDGTVPLISSSRRIDAGSGLNADCGSTNDKRCIGVCYQPDPTDPNEKRSDHTGMTQNPQVQSQILQILKFTNGFISTNPSFETNDCVLLSGSFALPSTMESHYLNMTGILNVLITDAQGNTNATLNGAYKKKVPGVLEHVIGNGSVEILMPNNNSYNVRFTGNGQPTAIEDIRGTTNKFSDASYIVRYDDVVIGSGVVAEIKIVNDQVDSLKYDSNGDGIPDTVIPPSRVITDPLNADLEPPQISVSWRADRATVNLTDQGSGVRRMFVRLCNSGECSGTFSEIAQSSYSVLGPPFTSGIEVVSEDNAGNRSNVIFYPKTLF